MVMHALDRKLLRDFFRLWAQVLAISMVLACGVAALLTSFGMYQALGDSRDAYYGRNRLADLWAPARRAPMSLLPEIAAIPGIRTAEARTEGMVMLDLPGREEVAVGQILSLPASGEPLLNLPILRSGRLPDPDAEAEIAVNEPFALANGYRPGDRFSANLNGARRELTITGTVLSPEFIYALGPGALMPDKEGFAVIWMPERAVQAAFDMSGAFNSVTIALYAGASEAEVIDRLDALLDPYGGTGAYGRDRQISDSFVSSEMDQLWTMTVVLPPIFFGVAAFLVNMVLGRIVALERSEIGLLKALGYSNAAIAMHYLMLAGLTAVVGILVGWGFGAWMAHGLATLYADFFNFPYLIFRGSWTVYAISGLIGLGSAAFGALRVALKAARLPPAVAMQPPAPPRFRRGLIDRIMARLRLSQPAMMILRNLVRWPLRAAASALGLSMAVAVLAAANFFDDALDKMLDTTFGLANRQDVVLMFTEDLPEIALDELRSLPGALQIEGQLSEAVILRNGHLQKHTGIEARRPDSDLSRVVTDAGRVTAVAPGGLVLTERLAEQLDLAIGDPVEVEFLSGRRETVSLPLHATIPQYIGLGAYADFETLNAIRRQAPRVSVANVTIDEAHRAEFHRALNEMPALAGTAMLTDMLRSFKDTIQKNIDITATVYIVIAVLITVGVTYNGARIQLSERARELASLRILGFSRGEVSFILVGETMVLALLAQPFGWLAGMGIAWAFTQGVTSDLYEIPFVIVPSTFARASLIVLVTALISALIVRRRIDRLDLVAVMKTRE
ncbi:FtsX-like permease family protein [Defluviimonas sp. D31]|uniref:ABC transporter permease n=1 Tax=Defluviimonas sp. D31 TaxID=3083253 RepID=UPI00296F8FEB|nr:FtsX-like permease family protein [Defluviimonas sp. D31]MDW4548368.1 FtsX-like permease family protein [Defluviimonas sp. D31]